MKIFYKKEQHRHFFWLILLSLQVSCQQISNRTPEPPPVVITTGTVKDGQTLAAVLKSHRVQPELIYPLEKAMSKAFDLRRFQSDKPYDLITSTDGIFQSFVYHDSATHSYHLSKSTITNAISLSETTHSTVWVKKRVTGEVQENMYKSMLTSGYPESFVATLMDQVADNIFGWKIDFFTEQRPGDKFDILLEQQYLEKQNKPLSGSDRMRVLTASYYGSGTRVKQNNAFRYQAPGEKKADYFDQEGNAVRKAFLRAPFTRGAFRVSSGFNPKRLHPILRVYRPHHGTDYAAAIGTPVSSIGKGKVIYAGWKGGYGNTVEVRHNAKYVSRYGHLSRIAVKSGQSIEQGRYIGNVGNTGLSTGPHLHFEMLVDGVQRNFLKMDFPSAASVSKKDMSDFSRVREALIEELKSTPVAQLTQAAVPSR